MRDFDLLSCAGLRRANDADERIDHVVVVRVVGPGIVISSRSRNEQLIGVPQGLADGDCPRRLLHWRERMVANHEGDQHLVGLCGGDRTSIVNCSRYSCIADRTGAMGVSANTGYSRENYELNVGRTGGQAARRPSGRERR